MFCCLFSYISSWVVVFWGVSLFHLCCWLCRWVVSLIVCNRYNPTNTNDIQPTQRTIFKVTTSFPTKIYTKVRNIWSKVLSKLLNFIFFVLKSCALFFPNMKFKTLVQLTLFANYLNFLICFFRETSVLNRNNNMPVRYS